MTGHGSMTAVAVRFGIFAAVAIALTVAIGASIAKVQWGGTYTVEAEFEDVSGLRSGDDVKIAGVKVGQVSGISTTDEGRARVRLALDDGVEVPDDSEAAVRWRNLLGQRIVYLYPGDAEASLDPGDEVARTRSVVDVGGLIDELGGVVSALDPVQFNQLLTAVSGALDGNEDRVGELLDGAGSLLSVLAERDDTIGGLLEDFATVSAALAGRDQQLRTMVENLALLTEAFAANEGLLDSTLAELARYSTSLDRILTTNQGQLSSIVASLAELTDTVVDRRDTVTAALANLPGALDALHTVTNRGEFITVQVLCFSVGPPPCPTPTTLDNASPATVLAGTAALANLGPEPPPEQSGGGPDPLEALTGIPTEGDR